MALARRRPPLLKVPAADPGDDLDRGILTTEIDPLLARVISVGFVLAIIALPVVQGAIELCVRGGSRPCRS